MECGTPKRRCRTQDLRAAGMQREVEACALVHFAFGPDAAAVPVDNFLHRSQADTAAFVLRSGMQALKYLEQLSRVRRVKTDTVVAYEINSLVVINQFAKLDQGLSSFARKLPGVFQKIREHNANESWVHGLGQSRLDVESHGPVRRGVLKPLSNVMGQCAEINLLTVQFVPGHLGQREQAINQAVHLLRRDPGSFQVLSACFIELCSVILQQGLAEP